MADEKGGIGRRQRLLSRWTFAGFAVSVLAWLAVNMCFRAIAPNSILIYFMGGSCGAIVLIFAGTMVGHSFGMLSTSLPGMRRRLLRWAVPFGIAGAMFGAGLVLLALASPDDGFGSVGIAWWAEIVFSALLYGTFFFGLGAGCAVAIVRREEEKETVALKKRLA
ncbi:MAG: hypothetical protein K2W96_18155, partial [Gemmataceae bacterium]|nr:hypothetical protein [Gemmataceae bacterium]